MRPSHPLKSSLYPLLATVGIFAALGTTAVPLVSVWQQRERADVLQSVDAEAPDAIPHEISVELRDGSASDADVQAIDRQYGVDLKPESTRSAEDHLFIGDLAANRNEDDVLGRLKADSRVDIAEPNLTVRIPSGEGFEVPAPSASNAPVGSAVWYRPAGERPISEYGVQPLPSSAMAADQDANEPFVGAPNDPRYAEQWNFRMIGMEDAWTRSHGKGVTVAVVDTGVAIGPSKKGEPCRDFGQTAYVKGYNFVDKSEDAFDDNAHGTHVAGTIAESTNNNEGVAGIAYEATILPVKVLSGGGSGTSTGVASGIRFAADKGAKIINMSLGASSSSGEIQKACQYAAKKGVVIICAAGNSGREGVGYPAAYPECIAVSSVGPTGNLAKYSSYGKQVALAAPGGDYVDSRNPADGILQNTNFPESQGGHGDDYYAFQGTSMACPHVAGVAALIEAQGVTDPARVRDILTKTATPKNDARKYGAGVLSASAATERAAQTNGIKVRHFLLAGLGVLLFTVGGRRKRFGLRLAMFGALAMGLFGPDWFADRVGADSALNLISFSALLPILAFCLLRRGPGVKIAGVLALGVAINLFANWNNDTLPFTTATFGESALPWTMANLGAATAIGCAAAWRAFRATQRR